MWRRLSVFGFAQMTRVARLLICSREAFRFTLMLRLGILDFDSSHCVEFTRRLNQVGLPADQWVDGARVVLGHVGESEMAPERIAAFRDAVVGCGVTLVDDPLQMLGQVHGVLVLSLGGDAHLRRARPFLEAGLPVYVDKPFACTLADAEQMMDLAARHHTCVFGSSALRYAEEVLRFQQARVAGHVHGVVSYGPAKRAAGNPGLFHYGIHATELLYALMGPGCQQVSTTFAEDSEVVTGLWTGGRTAALRGARVGATGYGFLAFCEHGIVHERVSTRYAYRNLCRAIVASFEARRPAVDPELTVELTRFVLAALLSEQRNGQVVALSEVK